MKTILLISVLILFGFNSFSQNLKALDDKYGFRDAKYEMPLSSFKNLIFVSRDDNIYEETYKATNIDLTIGDYRLEGIEYTFYKKKLVNISITISNSSYHQEGILKVLEAAYGEGVLT